MELLQSFHTDQVMIIGNRELAQSPGPVLARVWAFLGVKDVPSAHNTTQLNDAFSAAFPRFEKITGWQMVSSYDPMPPDLRLKLEDLYKPFNAELVQLLGRQLDW